MSKRYKKSEALLERALKTVPLGSQTFSKSITQLPHGISPYFADRGEGAYLYDVDGNKYTDFMNSLLSITLGYNDKDVVDAVKTQLDKGTIFSLASELEVQVAEKICEMVPCAEMVRFGKNGSDATAGAIRVARAYTKKEYVLVCGYHGWQDWYIGSTPRNLGVPTATSDLTHTFVYNDIDSLEKLLNEFEGEVAAVILEPVNVFPPEDNFLQKVKDLSHQHNAVLVFDETITGFRYANGGAQELFGVTPDIATFGKGLANGYPVSAIAGKKEIMKFMEEIFFSFTFGGETLSLAASLATLTKLQNEPVLDTIKETGAYLMDSLTKKIEHHQLEHIFSVAGYPVWSFIMAKDTDYATMWEIKTLMQQVMLENGMFMIGTHNMSYAHTKQNVDGLMDVYELFFMKMKTAEEDKNIKQLMKSEPLVNLFKVR
jgi:glutamate-1-semialdehyde 2,1-aminomutase